MSPQWLPQNIQKRILLYVLQQLSLFSEIDLPNLEEVTLNNIHLKDISLDPEKVGKIPGCNLRYGQVGNLELSGGVMGGVNIEASNVDIVVAPTLDLNEDIEKSVQLVLAQSSADLAQTILLDSSDLLNSILEENPKAEEAAIDERNKTQEEIRSNSSSSSSDSTKPSALGGVVARALDLALLRIQARIKCLNIKLLSELIDIVIKVEEVFVSTENGTRSIKVKGIKVVTLRPHVNAGDCDSGGIHTQGQQRDSSEKETKNDNDNGNQSESDDEYDDLKEENDEIDQSLMDSMVFTHDQASSIYMSATSQSFKESETNATPDLGDSGSSSESVLMYISELDIGFEGLTLISNLFIGIESLRIAMSPLIPTVLSVFNGISRALKLRIYQKRKSKSKTPQNSRFPQYATSDDEIDESEEYGKSHKDESQDEEEKPLFNRFYVGECTISITSALDKNGELKALNDNVYMRVDNLNIKRKHETLFYGGIEVFKILSTSNGKLQEVFSFQPSELEESKADIRFEFFSKISSDSKINEFTALLFKTGIWNLDHYSVKNLTELIESAQTIGQSLESILSSLETYNNLSSSSHKQKEESKSTNHFVLQTADFKANLRLCPVNSISIKILPIVLNLLSDEMKCQRVVIYHETGDSSQKIVSVSGILLSLKELEFRTFISHTQLYARQVIFYSGVTINVAKINIDLQYRSLMSLIEALGTFQAQLEQHPKRYNLVTFKSGSVYNPKKPKRRVNIATTPMRNHCDFRILFNEISFDVKQMKGDFGSLVGRIASVVLYKYNGELNAVVNGFKLNRITDQVNEKIIYYYEEKSIEDIKEPLLLGQFKSNGTIELKFQKLVIEIFAKWQSLTEENNVPTVTKVKSLKDLDEKPRKESGKIELRVQFKDCLIGVTPNTLCCKSYLSLNRVESDFMFNDEQIYAKSTLRDITFLIIDDVRRIKAVSTNKRQGSTLNPLKHFLKKDFLNIGNANNLHIGVTYNLNKEKLIQNSAHKNLYNKLAVLDIKINMDEINLETCGDSFYTFTQLLNDLKIPLILQDHEKFKTELDKEINLLENLDPLEDPGKQSYTTPGVENDTLNNDFEIIDEYCNTSDDNGDTKSGSIHNRVGAISVEDESFDKMENIDDNYFNKKDETAQIIINPITVNLNLGKLNLYMYDGYDWKETRSIIKGIVRKVEKESQGELETPQNIPDDEDHNEESENDDQLEVIQETLFQSIHVTLPKGIDPSHLTQNINKQLNESHFSDSKDITGYKDLKLKRSHRYKMSIELKSIDIIVNVLSLRDPLTQPLEEETEKEALNEIELVVDSVTIYDNLINSTWNKYLSYMSSVGEKEIGKSMLKLNLTTIREPTNLNFNETIIRVSILPLRLFIDQDTNEFLVRFFKFNDKRFNLEKTEEDLYVRKIEIKHDIKIKIDYKPKKVNFIGLRNGEFNELLNLININGLTIDLNAIKIYGIKGVEPLFAKLFEVWLPNIQKTQLVNLFSGVELFKPFINISESFKNVLLLPVTDFQDLNNQKFLKKLNKNGKEFLKITSYELLRLGYRLSNGTQNFLEQGEELLGGTGSKSRNRTRNNKNDEGAFALQNSDNDIIEGGIMENSIRLNQNTRGLKDSDSYYNHSSRKYGEIEEEHDDVDSTDDELEETKLVSLYSNQPKNFKQGVKLSYESIGKNYNLTKDEFLKLIERVNSSDNLEDSLKVILKRSPLLLLRPMIGTTEMILKALIGLSNEINATEHMESKDKYKSN